MKKRAIYICMFLGLMVLSSCKTLNSKDKIDENRKEYKVERNLVDTMLLKRGDFYKELVSNGKLFAVNRGELKFIESGVLTSINVKNGEFIKKGSVIASLDNTSAKHQLIEAKQQYQKAKIDFEDALIGFGYAVADTSKISADKLKIAYTRSGYLLAKSSLLQAQRKFDNCMMKAPFSGRVANLKNHLFEESKSSFCILLDDSSYEVSFSILETEITLVAVGQKLIVSPFSNLNLKYDGHITSINPLIDKNGQVLVTAKIKGHKNLMDGMSVKVFVKNKVKNVLVVPKSAVVIRDNYQVVFRYDRAEEKSIWTYITVLMANSDSYVITGNKDKRTKVEENDNIIISGNLNLADGSEVEVRKN